MKNILNTIVLLEIISVMCVRHTASFKNNYRGRPITKLFNTPRNIKDDDAETPDRRVAAADVATPRPREVGGACRTQVLAAARTQETVGGPNGAKRSEFRRCCMPVGVCKSGIFAPVVLQIDHHGGESWAFAPVVGFTCADSALLPPPCTPPARLRPQSIHTARHFQ